MAISRAAVVADHPQHMLRVALVARKRAQLARHLGRGGIGHAGHQRGQRTAHRAALVAVVAEAHVHQQAADIGIAQTERAEVIGKLRDLFRRELRHHHADFQRHGPEPRGMDIGLGVKATIVEEGQQVHRRQVAGGIVEEHVFRARVRPTDRPILRAGVPSVDRIMELDARIGTGPGGMAHLIPQITRLDRLGDLAISPADQCPVSIIFHRLQEGIRHADRVVGVLARDRDIGL